MQLITDVVSAPALIAPMLALVVGIVVFAAAHHLLIGLRRPAERVHLLFAGMCVLAAMWAAMGVPLYTATDSGTFVSAMRARLVLGSGVGILLIWFLAYYTGVRPRRFLGAATLIHALIIVSEVFRPPGPLAGSLTLSFIELPWGEQLTVGTMPRGSFWFVEQFSMMLDLGFGFWASFCLWRAGRGREAVPVLLALAALGAGLFGLYDVVLGPMPSAEVAFLGLILVMSLATSDRVVEASVMKDALADSERRLRTLVETAPEAVLLLDCESGTALEANDRALDLFQLKRPHLTGISPVLLAPPEQADGEPSVLVFEHRVRNAMRGGRPIFRWTVRGHHGQDVPCEARLVRLPGSDPAMLRLSLVDLQSMAAAEARQSELEAQLRQSQRLEAVGRLTGGIAHDFNNFLTVVQGNLEILLEGGELEPDEARELITQAFEASHRAGELTHMLLAFSRQQTLNPGLIDLTSLTRNMVRLLDRTLGEHIEIEVMVPEDLREFKADAGQLESAILNLAINARDAMGDGGRLTITAANTDLHEDETGWPDEAAAGSYVLISVADTGHGMDEATARRALDPFFTTKEVGEGSGLGLSMVHGFVAQSGGALRVDSALGEGTTIRLLFPACDAPGSAG